MFELVEPADGTIITLAQAKQALKMEDSYTVEDSRIRRCIRGATAACEGFLNRPVVDRGYGFTVNSTAGATISVELPLQARVDTITVTNGTFVVDGCTLTITVVADGAVVARVTAGYGDNVPGNIVAGVETLTAHLFENVAQSDIGLPVTVKALWKPYKIYF